MSRTYVQGTSTVHAVHDVSFTLQSGDIACILGRSGSGKSTLLHLLGCLDRPSSGQLWIGHVDVTKLSEKERVKLRRTRLGFVFQSLNLLPALTAAENVALPLRYAGISGRERMHRAIEMLGRVGLSRRADFLPSQMSGGEQQRVALARALVATPVVVLADEPTGELDSATASEIATLMQEINRLQGTTFLVVTHDEKLAATAARVFHMEDGRLSEA